MRLKDTHHSVVCCQWLQDLHSKVQLPNDHEPVPVLLLANKVILQKDA